MLAEISPSGVMSVRFCAEWVFCGLVLTIPQVINHSSHAINASEGPSGNEKDQKILEEQQRKLEGRRLNLLHSLRFDQMNTRHMSIERAYGKTCQWFLESPEYREWLDTSERPNRGFLWIKGKPGAGKSTLMRFILSHTQNVARGSVVSFFFHSRGHDLERSVIGLYRSLLVQLFEAHPELQRILDGIPDGHQWTVTSLMSCFADVTQHLGGTPLFCCVDAFDECEEAQVRGMVSLFGELVNEKTGLRVCFASRHYPEITAQKSISIVLDDKTEHDQDIAYYIANKLCIGDSPQASQICSMLQEKAAGIFMWVVLVVDILSREFDRGRKHNLYQKLQELPGNLHALFYDILTRGDEDKDALVLCIQWVLFAERPLSPQELFYAILSGLEPDNIPDYNPTDVTDDDIEKFILDSSSGLTEITRSKNPTVQFIHESVRDFLFEGSWLDRVGWNLRDFQGHSHDVLKRCCMTLISIEPLISRRPCSLSNNL